jgi:hypothetical protein
VQSSQTGVGAARQNARCRRFALFNDPLPLRLNRPSRWGPPRRYRLLRRRSVRWFVADIADSGRVATRRSHASARVLPGSSPISHQSEGAPADGTSAGLLHPKSATNSLALVRCLCVRRASRRGYPRTIAVVWKWAVSVLRQVETFSDSWSRRPERRSRRKLVVAHRPAFSASCFTMTVDSFPPSTRIGHSIHR